MVTDVLCQTNPYYLYDDLKSLFPQLRGLRLRICKMLLRLSNAQQSAETYFDDGLPKEYMAYVKAGNRKGQFLPAPDESCRFFLFTTENKETVMRVLDSAHDGTIVFLDRIYGSEDAVELWEQVKKHPRISATFDLFDCGIAVLNRSVQKMNYTMNL
jgi:hypothetical protein